MVLGQDLGEIKCCEESKETGNIIRYFNILLGEYLLKQKVVAVKPPEWKFMAILPINAKFFRTLGLIFCPITICVKNGKKLIINNFTLVILKVTKFIII